MNITVVRHGETVENAQNIVQGHLPGTLSKTGRTQAQDTALQLRHERYDVIYSSNLQRCVQTAALIRQYHPDVPYYETPQLRERSGGTFEGKKNDAAYWESLPGTYETRKFPDGESWGDVRDRTLPYLNQLLRKHPHDDILLVTHGGVVRAICSLFTGKSLEAVAQEGTPNAGIWRFEMTHELSGDFEAEAQ